MNDFYVESFGPIIWILGIIIAIIIFSIYHSIFNVTYFGCTGFFVELFICFCIGIVIAYFLGIAMCIIAIPILIYFIYKKINKKKLTLKIPILS